MKNSTEIKDTIIFIASKFSSSEEMDRPIAFKKIELEKLKTLKKYYTDIKNTLKN